MGVSSRVSLFRSFSLFVVLRLFEVAFLAVTASFVAGWVWLGGDGSKGDIVAMLFFVITFYISFG